MAEDFKTCNQCNSHTEHTFRLEKIETDIKLLYEHHSRNVERITVLEAHFSSIMTTMSELKSEIAKLSEVPNKRWETVVSSIISALMGGGIAILFTMLK